MPGDLVVYGVSRETACMCRRTGGNSEEGTPVPIPNTEVKLFSSDDTLGAAPRENRTSPFHPPTQAVLCFPAINMLYSAHHTVMTTARGEGNPGDVFILFRALS